MSNVIEYKGYIGSVEFSEQDIIFFGKILGIQAIGCGDADKKVNMISVGLSHRITVENLLNVDLTYAPPFSTSIDIIHFAARMLKNKLNEQV